jgi:hypothetical protein
VASGISAVRDIADMTFGISAVRDTADVAYGISAVRDIADVASGISAVRDTVDAVSVASRTVLIRVLFTVDYLREFQTKSEEKNVGMSQVYIIWGQLTERKIYQRLKIACHCPFKQKFAENNASMDILN